MAQGLEAELAGAAAPLGLEAELDLQRALMTEWPLYTAQLAAQVRVYRSSVSNLYSADRKAISLFYTSGLTSLHFRPVLLQLFFLEPLTIS